MQDQDYTVFEVLTRGMRGQRLAGELEKDGIQVQGAEDNSLAVLYDQEDQVEEMLGARGYNVEKYSRLSAEETFSWYVDRNERTRVAASD